MPMKPGWLLAAAKTTGELAYREWAEGVAPTQACWWAWVAASSDWAEVCTAVATHGVTPTALCAMRLELLEACRISLSDAPQARVVSSWMSAHLGWPCVTPGVAAVMDGGACPDCTRALMCIDPRSRFSAGHPIGPVQHLLRKAFPRRCQIRELLRFVSAYWCKYTEVEWFLRCAVFCCLGGFYVHHKPSTAPPLEARQALYDVCFRNGPMSLAAWMCAPEGGNALHGMQCTLLLVLQDAVVATVFLPRHKHAFTTALWIGPPSSHMSHPQPPTPSACSQAHAFCMPLPSRAISAKLGNNRPQRLLYSCR